MKFKLNDRFLSQIKQYLNQKEINYLCQEDQSTGEGILTVQDGNDCNLKLKHTIAQKLLNQFHKQKIDKPSLNVGDWVQSYTKLFNNLNEKLSNHLMILKYNLLKQHIAKKKDNLAKTILMNELQKQKYAKQSGIEQSKIRLGLQNISLRLKQKQNNGVQSSEQLERIKNLLKNGMWGTLSQIQTKLKKVQLLQQQIEQLKMSKQNESNQ